MHGEIEENRLDFYNQFILSHNFWKNEINYISEFINNYKNFLIKQLETLMIPSIALLIFKKKQLKEKNVYKNYFTQPYEHLLSDINKYGLLDIIDENITAFIKITSNSINKAIVDLKKIAYIVCDNDIKEITLGFGDLHSTSLMPLCITLKNKKKFFLKPSPCNPADCFYKICNILDIKYIRKNILGITNNYIIYDFLDYEPIVKTPLEFYKHIGRLMAVSTSLNLTDVHLENLLVNANYPVILDFESLFTFKSDLKKNNRSKVHIDQKITDIEATLFIEHFDKAKTERSFVSALQGGEVRNKSYLYPFVVNDGTDDFFVKYRKLSNYKSHNRAYDANGIIYAEDYADIIQNAFKNTLLKIIQKKHQIKNTLNREYINQFKYRHIIRSTAFYHFIYVRSFQPYELKNQKKYWDTIKTKLNNDFLFHFDQKTKNMIIDSEILALKQGLIPFFYRDACSKDLFDHRNLKIVNAFSSSIFDNIQLKIDMIDNNYINKNLLALKNCLNSSKYIKQSIFNKGWLE